MFIFGEEISIEKCQRDSDHLVREKGRERRINDRNVKTDLLNTISANAMPFINKSFLFLEAQELLLDIYERLDDLGADKVKLGKMEFLGKNLCTSRQKLELVESCMVWVSLKPCNRRNAKISRVDGECVSL